MLTMRAALTAVVLCALPAGGQAVRATIAVAPAGAPRLWEQRVTVGRQTLVSRFCLDDASTRRLAALAAARQRAAGAQPAGKVTVESGWRGACPASLKPGEMTGPDGRRFTIADLTRGAVP
jgi:hypothetical protein